MSVEIEVMVDDSGRPRDFIIFSSDHDVRVEIEAFVKGLIARDQIALTLDQATAKHTHYLEKRKDGRILLKRRGFN